MTENWHPDLQELAEEYSPGYVITAFKVRGKIDQEGYAGVNFSDAIKTDLRSYGPMLVKKKVEKHMNQELRETRNG